MAEDNDFPTDINTRRDPTPLEIICALVEARILIREFERGTMPPEFEVAWKDDLESMFDPEAPLPLSMLEVSAQEYRARRKRYRGW
jgi:hypothetical protein